MRFFDFTDYIRLAEELLKRGPSFRPVARPGSSVFSDDTWNIMNAARAEVVLCDARTRLAHLLPADCVQFWMRPEFFPTPFYSFAASLTRDPVVPERAEHPLLQKFLDVVRPADFPMRWALTEAMEAAYYSWKPAGTGVERAFAMRGITLKPSVR